MDRREGMRVAISAATCRRGGHVAATFRASSSHSDVVFGYLGEAEFRVLILF